MLTKYWRTGILLVYLCTHKLNICSSADSYMELHGSDSVSNTGSVVSPAMWAQLIAQVGFPVVAALVLAFIVWVLTQRVTGIETMMRQRDQQITQFMANQETFKMHAATLESRTTALENSLNIHKQETSKYMDVLKAENNQILRRLDDIYGVGRSHKH